MARTESGDVSGLHSTNASKKAGRVNMPTSSSPWKYGRPNDASHTRRASKPGKPANERPDSLFGGKQRGNTEPGSQRSDHK